MLGIKLEVKIINLDGYKINKISLSCLDDKRYILEDGVTSFACGHKNINTKNV